VPDDPPNRCTSCGRPLATGASGCPVCDALAETAIPDHPAEAALVAGRYLRQRLLGRGGAKEVWLAHDLTLDRPVALARARSGAVGAEARERMRREARLMARLGDHPHVVTVYDAVEDEGEAYIVARYMAGGSLAARLGDAPGGRLPVDEVLRTARALADALAHAHAHDVVHRDVKPGNVWLAGDGSAGLGDFGIAVAAGEPAEGGWAAAGTPYYQAPEQAAGGDAPLPQSDLYALGATIWELLCGRPPFEGSDARSLAAQHRHAEPEPPSRHAPGVGPELDALVLSLMAKHPADRPEHAAAVRDALDRLGGAPSVPVVPVASDREPLVGREVELAGLRRALAAARAGGARVVAVAGEPGIGKTRLVEEGAAEAGAQGAAVVRGRAGEESRAYGPWRAALRPLVAAASGLPARVLDDVRRLTGDGRPPTSQERVVRGAGPASGGEEERLRMFDAVAELVRAAARERALFVALEDVHAADRSSLALLSHLVNAAPDARLLVAVTYRSADLVGGHPLVGTLEALEHDGRLTRIALRGLPAAAVARFLPADASLPPAAVRALHERTAGNPFFLRELVRLLGERGELISDGGGDETAGAGGAAELPALVPDRVREVVGHRLEPLAPATREVLSIAGVVGRPFTIAGVARVGGLGRDAVAQALEPALAGHLVEARVEAPGRFGFSHDIVRDAVYDDLPPTMRARLHAAVAAALQESLEAGGDATAAEAAHHALAAARSGADPEAAWRLSLDAAREAAALQAHAEAAAHYSGALEALELGARATASERLETALALAAATFAAGDIEAARRRFRRVAAAARRSGAADVHARAALGFSEVQRYGGIDEDAIALLQGALDALPPDDSALRARACARLGQRLDPVTAQGRREALVDDGVAMARRLSDDDTLISVLSAAALVNWPPERAAARAAATDEVIRLAVRGADVAAVFWARTTKLRDALEAGEPDAVDAELDRLARLSAESRRTYYRWCLLVLQATRAIFAGRLVEGGRLAEEAVALNRRHGDDADQEHTVQRLAIALQRRRPADAPLDALRDYAARYPALPVWRAMLARAEWGLRPESARRSVAACTRDDYAAMLRTPGWLCGLALLAEPVAALGSAEQVARLAEALAPHAGRNVVMDDAWAAFGPVARSLGLLAAASGRAEEAGRHFARAVELAGRWGAAGWELAAIADWIGAGAPGGAREALRGRGLALARDLDLPWVAAELAQTTTP
jgi:eukaryotic-like serine/threonine-protein kinase